MKPGLSEKRIEAIKKNLKPFKPGQSGNPKGRPPLSESQRQLRDLINQAAPGIIDILIKTSKKGSYNAANVLLKKILPDLSSIEIKDNRDEKIEDLSHLSDEELNDIDKLQAQIEAIKDKKIGGNGTGHENPGV